MIVFLGWYGMTLILISAIVSNIQCLRWAYNPLIMAGGASLAVNAQAAGMPHFVILNLIFVLIGIIGLISDFIKWRSK